MHEAYIEADKFRQECAAKLETAKRALFHVRTEDDKAAVQEQLIKRSERLAKAETDLETSRARYEDNQRLLEQREAYFARSEFVQFCRRIRLKLNAPHLHQLPLQNVLPPPQAAGSGHAALVEKPR